MRKIASPQDAIAELRRILAYSQSPNPSREVLAQELVSLAERVAKADPLTNDDLTKPLTTNAIITFDPYPLADDGNLRLQKGDIPLKVLEAYLAKQMKSKVELRATAKRQGASLICEITVDGEKSKESVVVGLQKLKK